MTVESNNAIAIGALSDWLKSLTPVFRPIRSKNKTIRTLYADFSRALTELQVIARNSDWFIALYAVVIGRSNYSVGIGFSTLEKRFISKLSQFYNNVQNTRLSRECCFRPFSRSSLNSFL